MDIIILTMRIMRITIELSKGKGSDALNEYGGIE